MRKPLLLAAVLLSAAAVLLASGVAVAQVPQRQATLTGAQEAPDPGDGNGRGQFTWSLDGQRLCYLLSVKRIGTAAAAHVHRGRSGVAGPVVVELEAPVPRASAECVQVAANLADALRERPGRFYVNVHNAAFPNGAVRGQLHR
jgi:hypothetical protein